MPKKQLHSSTPSPHFSSSILTVLRIAIVLSLLVLACGVAGANEHKVSTKPCVTDPADLAGLSGDTSSDVHAIKTYSETANHMLHGGKFDELDCLADSLWSNRDKFSGGFWKLHNLYVGLGEPLLHPTHEDWTTHMALVRKWVSAKPQSITARVVLAQSYIGYGDDARGTGYADTVSESGWRLYEERYRKAQQVLVEAEKLPAKSPEWYVAMLVIARGQGWEPIKSRALADEAIKFEPGYYYFYRTYADSILPKWNGQPGDSEKFLTESADRIAGDAGDILYFQVGSFLICGCDNDVKLSWSRIQKGFAALEKKSGPAIENWNSLAHVAVAVHDPVVAGEMFAKIGDQWSESTWKQYSYYSSSKEWAQGAAGFAIHKRTAEDAANANIETPDGQHYDQLFADKVKGWLQQCMAGMEGSDLGNFELLIKLDQDGKIEDWTGDGQSPLTPCMGHKFVEVRDAKAALLPPPPKPGWWVRLDFHTKDPAAAALK